MENNNIDCLACPISMVCDMAIEYNSSYCRVARMAIRKVQTSTKEIRKCVLWSTNMYKLKTESMKVPAYVWAKEGQIEDGAIKQISNASGLPFVFHHTVLCSDAHQGYGIPVGGVVATQNCVVPFFVGVDIGCGMCAVRTSLKGIDRDTLKLIMGRIRELVPVGFEHHKTNRDWEGFNNAPDIPIIQQELNASRKQLGTLGGGNHFIEIQKSDESDIWIMIHSGSRNFGLKIANEYHKKALALCSIWHSELTDKDLAFLPIETKEAKEYLEAMNFALEFAKQNRFEMITAIKSAFVEQFPDIIFDEVINIHHNYAAWENHFGQNVIVHRKGATSAREGQIGIIPGSQGTKSYIVKGRGNRESFMSCSHGAGRKMGRKQATRELNLEAEKKLLDDQGIIHGIRNTSDLDEAAGAYKDISEVMENQKDLVEIVFELSPLGVIKG